MHPSIAQNSGKGANQIPFGGRIGDPVHAPRTSPGTHRSRKTRRAHVGEPRMQIQVECYAGYRGEETPRRVQIGDRRMVISEILDRWLAPQHRYFKFRTEDGAQWIIRHDMQTGDWELTFFKRE